MAEVGRADVALQVGVAFDAASQRVITVGGDGVIHAFGCGG
jgi:hypothetical protein